MDMLNLYMEPYAAMGADVTEDARQHSRQLVGRASMHGRMGSPFYYVGGLSEAGLGARACRQPLLAGSLHRVSKNQEPVASAIDR
jgi:hypothetical protein